MCVCFIQAEGFDKHGDCILNEVKILEKGCLRTSSLCPDLVTVLMSFTSAELYYREVALIGTA